MEQVKNRTKADILADLRSQIREIEGFKADTAVSPVKFNIPEIDQALPDEVFPLGAIHELLSQGNEMTAASTGFMSGLLGMILRAGGFIIWIAKKRTVFPPGLARFGLETDRIVFIDVERDQEILWATEEALRSKGIAAVVSEIADVDLTSTRRMQLAVEQSQVTGFLLRSNPKKSGSSSCVTSWRIRPLPTSFSDGMPGVGFPHWNVELTRARNGKPGEWQIEWREDAFHLVRPDKAELLTSILRAVR